MLFKRSVLSHLKSYVVFLASSQTCITTMFDDKPFGDILLSAETNFDPLVLLNALSLARADTALPRMLYAV